MSTASEAIRRRNGRVDRYCQLVRPIALHYRARCAEPLDDLIQVGLMGLLRAAELFSDEGATPFEAFAKPHIRGAILHYLRDRCQPIRLSRRLQEQLDRRRRCLAGASMSDEQLRQAMGLSESQWQHLEQARRLNQLQPLTCELEDRLGAPASDEQQDRDRDGLAQQALALLELSGPLATTSANVSGQPPATTAEEAARQFADVPLLGPMPWPEAGGMASTVLAWREGGGWQVLRAGALLPPGI